jgi:hypothetical protein
MAIRVTSFNSAMAPLSKSTTNVRISLPIAEIYHFEITWGHIFLIKAKEGIGI